MGYLKYVKSVSASKVKLRHDELRETLKWFILIVLIKMASESIWEGLSYHVIHDKLRSRRGLGRRGYIHAFEIFTALLYSSRVKCCSLSSSLSGWTSVVGKPLHDGPGTSRCCPVATLTHWLHLTPFISAERWHFSNIISRLSLPGIWPFSFNLKCPFQRSLPCITEHLSLGEQSLPSSFSIGAVKLESSLSFNLSTSLIIRLL